MAGYSNVQILEGGQAKIEAVRGVPEAAMTRWLTPIRGGLTWTYDQPLETSNDQTRSYHATEGSTLGLSTSRITYEENLAFEDVAWWLRMILKGGAAQGTGVTTGSTPPGYTYASTPNSIADDLDTFTLKAGTPGLAYLFSRCAVNRATFRFNPASGGDVNWRMALEIFALFGGVTTFDAPTLVARTKAQAKGTKLYIDEPGGTIGTTPVLGALRSGNIVVDNQIEEKAFSENIETMHTDFARGEQLVTGELVLEHANDNEFAKRRAGTNRKIRFLKEGAQIGITPTTLYTWQVDIPVAKYATSAPGLAGQNKILTLGWVGERNPASPQPITTSVVNALDTITA